MNELDLLVENYFTDSFEASDLFRLVEQVMGEQKDFSFPHQQVVSLMRTRFDDDTISLTVSERDPRQVIIRVPTSDRIEAAADIKRFLEANYGEEYSVINIKSRGNIIGAGLKKGRRVVVKYALKPTTQSLIRNKGDVAEGVLGAAIAAAFVSGGNQISVADVEAFLDELNQNENELVGTTKTAKVLTKPTRREDGTIDTITCVIRLSTINFNDLMNKDKRSALTGLFNAAVAYANSEEVLEATIAVATNGENNKVAVVSDGVSKQKGTKIDIKVFLDGDATSIGRISLKAGGTAQLGQVGGTWEGISGLFKIMFGIEIDERLKEGWQTAMMPAGRTAKRVQDEAKKIYEDAHLKIDKLLNPSGDDVEAEIDLIQTIAIGMNYQVALKEEGIILVHLDAGDFKVLDFAMLEDVLREQEVDLASILKVDGANPIIQIIDKKASNKPLFQVRFKQEGNGKTIRHYVEKKQHMVDLLAEARKQTRLNKKR
jgi:hypothetical protein